MPASASFQQQRDLLRRLLGDPPRIRFEIASRADFSAPLADARCERLELVSAGGERIRAFLTGPHGPWINRPAALYCHAHGARYEIGASEILTGRPSLQSPSYGEALARAGFLALCIDMPCFGERNFLAESEFAKRCLWRGRPLFGLMLAELSGALDLMRTLPEIDPARIGAMGFSMGATHAFWLGALRPELAVVAHLGSFADLATIVASGAHDHHLLYMMVPGLLPAMRTGQIAGMIAPRPQLAGMGLLDPMTPPEAIEIGLADVRAAYRAADAEAALRIEIAPDSGHSETPAMRAAVIAFLSAHL